MPSYASSLIGFTTTTLVNPTVVTPPVAARTWAGVAPALSVGQTITPPVATVVWAGVAPAVVPGVSAMVAPPAAAAVFAGVPPVVAIIQIPLPAPLPPVYSEAPVETYTVFAYDLNTNTPLGTLPATGLKFGCRLNDAGPISFDLNLQNPVVAAKAQMVLAYQGTPVALYVQRSIGGGNGVLVWGGILLTTNHNKATGVLSIGGKEWLAYFDQRVITADYSQTSYPSGIDPAQLVLKALTDAQSTVKSGPGASLGIQVVGGTSTIPHFVPGYPITQHTTVGQILADMAATSAPGSGTVDTVFTSAWSAGGSPVVTATIATMRAGRSASNTNLIFDLSKALDYSWPTDATKMGTTLIATGAGSGSATVSATVPSPYTPVGGLGQPPRLDQVYQFNNVQSQSQISAMAKGIAQLYGQAVVTPTVKVPTATSEQPLGSWVIGDDARLYTQADERFPNGLDQYWRIVAYDVEVPDEGIPTVTLTFNTPPVF